MKVLFLHKTDRKGLRCVLLYRCDIWSWVRILRDLWTDRLPNKGVLEGLETERTLIRQFRCLGRVLRKEKIENLTVEVKKRRKEARKEKEREFDRKKNF